MAVNLKIVSQVVASGTPGPAGKSAYQIAVDNGFEGTESEWLKVLHPFKGWFDSVSELEEEHSAPSVGEYAYVKGATPSDPVKIYECSTEGSWSDSGRTVDTSTVQTFGSGEAVNDVNITDDSSDIEENNDKIPTAGAVADALGNVEFSTGEKVKNVGIDNEPTVGSQNLVTSGGVKEDIDAISHVEVLGSTVWEKRENTLIAKTGLLQPNNDYDAYIIQNDNFDIITGETAIASTYPLVAFYNGAPHNSTLISYVAAAKNKQYESFNAEIPSGTKYIAITATHEVGLPTATLIRKHDLAVEIEDIDNELTLLDGKVDNIEELINNTVKITEQSLTEGQKAQAKENIGLPSGVDSTPTKGSTNLITSGGVNNAVGALHTKIIDGSSIWEERTNKLITSNGQINSNDAYDVYVIENIGYSSIEGYASSYAAYPLIAFYNGAPTSSTLIDKISATTTAEIEHFSYDLNDTIKYIAISYAHAASEVPSASLLVDVNLLEAIDRLREDVDELNENLPSVEDNPEFLYAEEDSNGNVLRGISKDEEIHYMPQRLENKVILSKEAYQSLVDSIAKFQIPEISIIELGEKEIVFSNVDSSVTTMDDLRCQNYSIIKNPDGMYYMYYLGCGSEGYRFWDNTTAQYAPYSVLFAHSTDGVNWTRGFPQGITPPYSNYPNSIKFTDNNGNIINSLYGPVLRVNDSEYPYRMITTEGNVIMMFSRDGFTWDKSVIIDGTQSRDTVSGAVVRGDVIKIYTRGWSGNYPPRAVNGYGQRMIVVLYCDIYGRKLSPAVPFVDRASNYNAPLAVLDDRREIIFPTLYQGEDYSAIANCYIIDGTKVRQLTLDNDFLMNSGDDEHPWKSIWFVGGLFYENNKFYAYYNAFDVVHNQLASANANGRLYRVEVKLKSRVVTNVEQIN